MRILKLLATFSPVLLLAVSSAVAKPAHSQATITLVKALDVPGAFPGSQAMYNDASHIFLASSAQLPVDGVDGHAGILYVVQNEAPEYALEAAITLSTEPLVSVVGDGKNLYVTCLDGNLYEVEEAAPFKLVNTISYRGVPLSSVAVTTTSVYVGQWSVIGALDSRCVYVSQLNAGDVMQAASKFTPFTLGMTYGNGNNFDPGVTQCLSPTTGASLGTIPNPPGYQVALHTDGTILAQTAPGGFDSINSAGRGVSFYNVKTLKLLATIPHPLTNADAAVTTDNETLAYVTTEAGTVEAWRLDPTGCNAPVLLASINLQAVTHQTDPQSIEIRGIAVDPKNSNRIFVSSSWGDATDRSASLPSAFVLSFNLKGGK